MRTLKVKIATLLLLTVGLGYSQEKKMMHQDHHKMDKDEMIMMDSKIPKFKNEKVTTAYEDYLNLKSTILKSDQELAKEAAEQLVHSLEKLQGTDQLQQAATKLAASPDLESQKAAFSDFSSEFADFLKGKVAENQLYLARCPMANNSSGGFWLSHEEAIQNPFFAGKMLKCGSIQETIK
jgi:membrane carboxypeptidase/penicillin-binding protein